MSNAIIVICHESTNEPIFNDPLIYVCYCSCFAFSQPVSPLVIVLIILLMFVFDVEYCDDVGLISNDVNIHFGMFACHRSYFAS